jgi:hypothetical protein
VRRADYAAALARGLARLRHFACLLVKAFAQNLINGGETADTQVGHSLQACHQPAARWPNKNNPRCPSLPDCARAYRVGHDS